MTNPPCVGICASPRLLDLPFGTVPVPVHTVFADSVGRAREEGQ